MTYIFLKRVCVAVSIAATMSFFSTAIAENNADTALQALGRMKMDARWSLRVPKETLVSYSGVVSFDKAGTTSASMLYPAPGGIAGLLAAVITHSVIVDSAKSAQKTQFQEEADKVLSPYQPILSNFTNKELMQRGLEKTEVGGGKRLIDFADKSQADWYLESTPQFSLTQDQRAIIMENTVSVYAALGPSEPVYQNTVRIVSSAYTEMTPPNYWTDNQGEKLKDESARLFAESLSLLFKDISANNGKEEYPQKTIRYLEGGNEKMERGGIIQEHCNRLVFKTLRGWLMSVPSRHAQPDLTQQCEAKQSKLM